MVSIDAVHRRCGPRWPVAASQPGEAPTVRCRVRKGALRTERMEVGVMRTSKSQPTAGPGLLRRVRQMGDGAARQRFLRA
jgi:hypothetical protein